VGLSPGEHLVIVSKLLTLCRYSREDSVAPEQIVVRLFLVDRGDAERNAHSWLAERLAPQGPA
jgi:hypothetical protein